MDEIMSKILRKFVCENGDCRIQKGYAQTISHRKTLKAGS